MLEVCLLISNYIYRYISIYTFGGKQLSCTFIMYVYIYLYGLKKSKGAAMSKQLYQKNLNIFKSAAL